MTVAAMAAHTKGSVEMRAAIARSRAQSRPARLLAAAQAHQELADEQMRIGRLGAGGGVLGERFVRVLQLARLTEDGAELAPALAVPGREHQRGLEAGDALLQLARLVERPAQV